MESGLALGECSMTKIVKNVIRGKSGTRCKPDNAVENVARPVGRKRKVRRVLPQILDVGNGGKRKPDDALDLMSHYTGIRKDLLLVPRVLLTRLNVNSGSKLKVLTRFDKRMAMRLLFDKGLSVQEAVSELKAIYGPKVTTTKTCRLWYRRFEDDRSCRDRPRTGRPQKLVGETKEVLRRDVANDGAQSLNTLGLRYHVSSATIRRCLHMMRFRSRRMGYHPYRLSTVHKSKRATMANDLLTQNRSSKFVHNLVTMDESKILSYTPYRGLSWTEQGTIPKSVPKVTVGAKWDGIVHREFLDQTERVDSARYQQMLRMAANKLGLSKTNRLPLLHDNARCHTAKKSMEVAASVGFDVLSHPPYSPDLSPTDYHLFRSLKNVMRNKSFSSKEELLDFIDKHFAGKPKRFYKRGIDVLPSRWKAVVDAKGDYCFRF